MLSQSKHVETIMELLINYPDELTPANAMLIAERIGESNPVYEHNGVKYQVALDKTPEKITCNITHQLNEGYLRIKYPSNLTFSNACNIVFYQLDGYKIERPTDEFELIIIKED